MNLSFFATGSSAKRQSDLSVDRTTSDADTLAQLARFIYAEMDIEPRQMHAAIQLAREQLLTIRELLVSRGLRRPRLHEVGGTTER